ETEKGILVKETFRLDTQTLRKYTGYSLPTIQHTITTLQQKNILILKQKNEQKNSEYYCLDPLFYYKQKKYNLLQLDETLLAPLQEQNLH
ncbi:MAG: hypothetical protein QW594_03660, partial [Candidatus Woesearchaeota archaeon]